MSSSKFFEKFYKDKVFRTKEIEGLNGTYSLISPKMYVVNRKINVEGPFTHTDIFGNGWVFFYCLSQNGNIKINQDGKLVSIGSSFAGFAPNRCVIEWCPDHGEYQFGMLICGDQESIPMCESPFVYEIPYTSKPNIFKFFDDFLDKNYTSETINVSRCVKPPELVVNVRDWLINNWEKPFQLNELSNMFNTSPSVLSRYFKKAYGMPPLKYCNNMKVLAAVQQLILNKFSIAQISYDLGFSDPRLFNEHFRQIFSVKPFSFRNPIEQSNDISLYDLV